jgi:hypothetical protein
MAKDPERRAVEMAVDRAESQTPPVPALPRIIARARGARLCFGRPVRAGDTAVVPVASVWVAGGWGSGGGRNAADSGEGGGGGGALGAKPIGYIEVTPNGTRFRRILDPSEIIKAFAGALVTAISAAALLRRGEDPSTARRALARVRRRR